jgi:diguanylate cyclase (GGDEF)-like protein
LTAEIEKRHEHERLNLLELDFLKKLQLMIGETEDPAFVIKNSFALLKNFLNFQAFAALMLQGEDINIQIYPNVGSDTMLMECITTTLMSKAPERSKVEKHMSEMMAVGRDIPPSGGTKYNYMTVDISSRDRIYGYAGLYRVLPFHEDEAAIFNRFCSNIAMTLEKIRLFNEIKNLSIHDGLTGIYNHAFIVEALKDEVERSKRYGSLLSIALFDIDDFKKINDTYGHLAGDAVLQKLAELLKTSLRAIDIVGRYGGEEFLAILPETDGLNGYIVAERFKERIENETFASGEGDIKITISGGVAHYAHGMDVNRLIKVADDSLYTAKRKGKNRIFYE